jgi:GDP-4-dehydro-6-deoxy-D-mannose reductase
MPTALVTGADGFVASYLISDLIDQGVNVVAFDVRSLGDDIRDYETVRRVVEETVPDYVYHLAAQTWPRESITDPRRALEVNTIGALNLLEALRHTGSQAKVLLAGTSEEYGYDTQPMDRPLTEEARCWPTTPYGVSKLAQTHLGMTYARQYGLHVVCTRAFNHSGPGQPAIYAASSFAKRVAQVEKGIIDKVSHGNLTAMRNFTHVSDVVKAYRLVIDAEPDIYNVCSHENWTMEEILQTLVSFSDRDITTEMDPALKWGDSNQTFPTPSYDKLYVATSWQPTLGVAHMLNEMLDYWRVNL